MSRLLLLAVLALFGCASTSSHDHSTSAISIKLSGTIEKVCLECSEALVVPANGKGMGGLLWDVLTVRITSPQSMSGSVISVNVFLQDPSQRKRYELGHTVSFPAATDAIKERRVMLNAQDLGG